MKTQLLEDIGHSATLSLVSSEITANRPAKESAAAPAPTRKVEPGMSRLSSGVWRQKPAAPAPIALLQPGELPTSTELQDVFEEIAALEAQYVGPQLPEAPSAAEADARQEPAIPPVKTIHRLDISRTEPAISPTATLFTPLEKDPLFDFMPMAPADPEPEPFTIGSDNLSAPKRRYVIWGACVLAGAMLIQGGRWFYQDGGETGARGLSADAGPIESRADKVEKRRVNAAKEFMLGPGGEVRVASTAPPLVLLEPDRAAETKAAPSPPVASDSALVQTPRQRSGATSGLATANSGREPDRQYVRASADATGRASARGTAMAETLKACREHGYHEAQCIKRACSVTKYGFVCRGQ